jgi:nitrite reductase (NADH) small subunit
MTAPTLQAARAAAPPQVWTAVCALDTLTPERGVCALVAGRQVAVFRLLDGTLAAVGNRDPFSGAFVMSRGIVGTRGDEPTVASPLYKQVFSLRTGAWLDAGEGDPEALPVHAARVVDGTVLVALADPPDAAPVG